MFRAANEVLALPDKRSEHEQEEEPPVGASKVEHSKLMVVGCSLQFTPEAHVVSRVPRGFFEFSGGVHDLLDSPHRDRSLSITDLYRCVCGRVCFILAVAQGRT